MSKETTKTPAEERPIEEIVMGQAPPPDKILYPEVKYFINSIKNKDRLADQVNKGIKAITVKDGKVVAEVKDIRQTATADKIVVQIIYVRNEPDGQG